MSLSSKQLIVLADRFVEKSTDLLKEAVKKAKPASSNSEKSTDSKVSVKDSDKDKSAKPAVKGKKKNNLAEFLKKKKKKASEYYDVLISKFAQEVGAEQYHKGPSVFKQDAASNLPPPPPPTDGLNMSYNAPGVGPSIDYEVGGLSGTQNPTITTKPVVITNTLPLVDPVIQKMLGVNTDGKLGQQTRKALDIYKKQFNLPTDQAAFADLKKLPQYNSITELLFDDTNLTYKK